MRDIECRNLNAFLFIPFFSIIGTSVVQVFLW